MSGSLVPVSRATVSSSGRPDGAWAQAQRQGVGIALTVLVVAAFSSSSVVGLAALGFAACIVSVGIRRFHAGWKHFVVEHNRALGLLARGDLEGARAVFAYWAATSRIPRASCLARYNLSWTRLRAGKLREALEVIVDNERRNRDLLKKLNLWPLAALHRAYAFALLGELDGADRALGDVQRRFPKGTAPSIIAVGLLVRAIVACRRGDPAAATSLIDADWVVCEATLTGETLRPLRIIRAFARASADLRDAGIAARLLENLRPAYPAEFTFLGTAWPEMAAFLAAHDLSQA